MTLEHPAHAWAEALLRKLVHAKPTTRGLVITTPVLFPSGAHVTVLVSMSEDRCLISDDGAAFAEADMMGASVIFRRAAHSVAAQAGVRFNNFEIFEADARPEKAAGMIAIIADAARSAVQVTAERLAKKLEAEAKVSVVERLRDSFGAKRVSENVILSGASTHEWTLDALVTTESGTIVVETVMPSPVSVSAAYMKLDDIRRLDNAPRTVAALKNKAAFGSDNLLILNRTARLIDLAADRKTYLRLAA